MRFKHGRITVLLYSEPLTSWDILKIELMKTLQERYPDGLISTISPAKIPIPEFTDSIALGLPVDIFEPSKGWRELEKESAKMKDCPKGAGLKDGSMVAFAFRKQGEEGDVDFEVEIPSYEEEYASQMGAEEEEDNELQ